MLTLLLATLALADVVPLTPQAETCTVAAHEAPTRACLPCRADRTDRSACEELERQGLAIACKTSGATAWTEVLCGPKAPPAPRPDLSGTPAPAAASAVASGESTPPAQDAPASGARCSHLQDATPALLLALGLVALRRRRSTRSRDRAAAWLLPALVLGTSALYADVAPGGGCRCDTAATAHPAAVDVAPEGGCRCASAPAPTDRATGR